MLSIERMVKIDPSLAALSEQEVVEVRNSLYEAAQLAFEVYWTKKYGSKYPLGSFTSITEGIDYDHGNSQ